jgi:hypothetical protein
MKKELQRERTSEERKDLVLQIVWSQLSLFAGCADSKTIC